MGNGIGTEVELAAPHAVHGCLGAIVMGGGPAGGIRCLGRWGSRSARKAPAGSLLRIPERGRVLEKGDCRRIAGGALCGEPRQLFGA